MVSVGERFGLTARPDFECEEIDEGLRVTRTSTFTRRRNSMVLPITEEQLKLWRSGQALILEIFPHLTAEQREFLMSGASPEEWADMFSSDEEEED